MARGKTRLLTYHSQPNQRKLVTLSNTSTRVRKFVSTVTTAGPSTPLVHATNNVDQPSFEMPAMLDAVDSVKIDHPVGIHV